MRLKTIKNKNKINKLSNVELIKKDKLGISIKNNYDYSFRIPESGVYVIEIIATAKSWWQNLKGLKSFFNDDDLTLKIDGVEFPKLNGRGGLFDGEVAWNGNNLKGFSKTNIFIINLNEGRHALGFLADKNPVLESIAISRVNEEEINYLSEENNPAQDGDRRQWITIIPVNVSIKNLSIKASAKKYPEDRDDDDIKLIINGAVQKNESDKSHRNWFWCGRILDGLEKEFNRELNLEKGLHYIELWADRMPEIKSATIVMEKSINAFEDRKTFEYILGQVQGLYGEIGQEVEFDKIPDPVEIFSKYDKEIKIASIEFDIEPSILKATVAQESSFGNAVDHDGRYIEESGLMGLEKNNSIEQLIKLGYTFDYNKIQDVIRASAAYYKWLANIQLEKFKDTHNPLKLYTQYSKDLDAQNTKAPGIKEFLYYYFYYKQ